MDILERENRIAEWLFASIDVNYFAVNNSQNIVSAFRSSQLPEKHFSAQIPVTSIFDKLSLKKFNAMYAEISVTVLFRISNP